MNPFRTSVKICRDEQLSSRKSNHLVDSFFELHTRIQFLHVFPILSLPFRSFRFDSLSTDTLLPELDGPRVLAFKGRVLSVISQGPSTTFVR